MSATRKSASATLDASAIVDAMVKERIPVFTLPLDPQERRIKNRVLDRRDLASAARRGEHLALDDALDLGVVTQAEADALLEASETARRAESERRQRRRHGAALKSTIEQVARERAQERAQREREELEQEARRRLSWPERGWPADDE